MHRWDGSILSSAPLTASVGPLGPISGDEDDLPPSLLRMAIPSKPQGWPVVRFGARRLPDLAADHPRSPVAVYVASLWVSKLDGLPVPPEGPHVCGAPINAPEARRGYAQIRARWGSPVDGERIGP